MVLRWLFLPLLLLSFAVNAQTTRIRNLPTTTQFTTNTSIAVDDGTYGTRRITWPQLLSTIQTNAAYSYQSQRITRTVANMAELVSLTPASLAASPVTDASGVTATNFPATVVVQGYYTPGDGGGGIYVLTNSIAGVNEYGGQVLAAGGSASWLLAETDRINVKQFGAIGNGDADDTSRLQAAWNARAGRPYFVPPGNYKLTGTVWVTNVNASDRTMIFQGAGRADGYSTVFTQYGNNAPAFEVNGNDTKIGGFNIKWATRALSTDSNAVGIRVRNSWNGQFNNISVYNANRAVQLANTYSQFSMLWQDLSIFGVSHTGIDCAGTGTQNTWVKVDVRNYPQPGSSTGTISSSGTNATVTGLSSLFTQYLRTNNVILVSGSSVPEFNGGFTITGVSSNTVTYTIGATPSGTASGSVTMESYTGHAAGQGIFIGSGSQQIFFGLNVEWFFSPRAITANEFVSIYGLHLEGIMGDGTASSWIRLGEGGEIYGMDVINCSVLPGGSYSLFEVQQGYLKVPVIRTRDLCYTGGSLGWYFGAGYMPPPLHFQDTTLRWDRTGVIGTSELQNILSKGITNALTKIGDTGIAADALAWDPTPTGNSRMTLVGTGIQITDNIAGTTNKTLTLQPNSAGSAGVNIMGVGDSAHNAFEFIPTSTDRRLRFGDTYINSVINSTGGERLLTLQSGHTSQGLGVFSLNQAAGAAAFIPTTDNERLHFTGSRIDGFQNSDGASRVSLDLNLGSFVVVDNIRYANSSGPQDLSGVGAPSASVPNGSTYRRTDGTGPNFYVRENGAWVAK